MSASSASKTESEALPNRRSGEGLDRVGAFASAACAVHCVICAVLPSALAALGLAALLGHEAEWTFTGLAMLIAAIALVVGWRRHRSYPVAIILALGITGLLASRLLEGSGVGRVGTAIGVMAGVVLVAGHIINIRASRRVTKPVVQS